MLRADSPNRRRIAGLRGSTLLCAAAVLGGWLMLTACDNDSPAPASQGSGSSAGAGNADLFNSMNQNPNSASRPLPPPPPDDDGPGGGQGPGAASDQPSLLPVLDPAVAAECTKLRADEKTLRDQADQLREKRVAPATEAYEKASSDFEDCQQDYSCANNESRYAALGAAAQRTERAMETEEEALMEVEGKLHDISQSISVKCGDF